MMDDNDCPAIGIQATQQLRHILPQILFTVFFLMNHHETSCGSKWLESQANVIQQVDGITE